MFGHIFVYRLKCIVRDRPLVFWSLIYPMVVALFFQPCVSNIGSNESFKSFPIAVVDNEEYQSDKVFQAVLSSVSADNPDAEPSCSMSGLKRGRRRTAI